MPYSLPLRLFAPLWKNRVWEMQANPKVKRILVAWLLVVVRLLGHCV